MIAISCIAHCQPLQPIVHTNDSIVSVTKDTAKLVVNKYYNLKKQNKLYRESDSILLRDKIKQDQAILDLHKIIHLDSANSSSKDLKIDLIKSEVKYYQKQVSVGKVKNTIVEVGLSIVIGFLLYKRL